MTPLLSIRGLSVRYAGDDVPHAALADVSLDLPPGEKLAVIGESGSGKSTLALAVAGLLPGDAEGSGSIAWPGLREQTERTHSVTPPSGLPAISPTRGEIDPSFSLSPISTVSGKEPPIAAEIISPLVGEMAGRPEGGAKGRRPVPFSKPLPGRDIGFVFQDPAASLDPVLTVGEQVAEVARTHLAMNWRQAYDLAAELFGRVRLPEPGRLLRAYPHQLSGGQKQRVVIAAAIAARPQLLIADEATSALDTIVQAEIIALLGRLVAEDGMALLFISHDIALASALADRIAVFREGRLVEIGPARQLLSEPRDPYTRLLLDAHLGIDGAVPRLGGGIGITP